MEHMHRLSTAHNHIAHTRDHEHIDTLSHTVFQDDIALMTVDTADEHALHSIQQAQVVQAFLNVQCHLDIVFFGQSIFTDELFQTMPNIVDHCSRLGLECIKIPSMRQLRPD